MTIEGKTAAEIFDSVRAQAQAGALAPGMSLPPVRELAAAPGQGSSDCRTLNV